MFDWQIALTVVACTAAALFLWWFRDRRLADHRHGIRALYRLSEAIISSRSPSEIVRQLLATLPKVSQVSGVRLYLLVAKAESLDRVPSSLDPEPDSLPLDADSGPAVCLRNRSLITIADTRRNPLYDSAAEPDPPRSVLFVPMFVEEEVLGVLELDHAEGVRQFSQDQRAAAQHLANQVGIALKLQEQESVREQLFRSEKLAAAGELVSGVVNELQDPLDTLATRAGLLPHRTDDSLLRRELQIIESEARRASEIVSRLVGLSRTDQAKARPFDLNSLLGDLIRFREREWRLRGVRLRTLLADEPLTVLGAEAQLEQVFLNLLVHAEQSLQNQRERTITIGTRLLVQRAHVEIGFSSAATSDSEEEVDPFLETDRAGDTRLGLPVCRGIVQSHGGEVRLLRDSNNGSRFELELPLAPDATREQVEARDREQKNARQLTVILTEPEPAAQRHLISLLSGRGHRAIPVTSAGEAVDLARRLHFDVALSSTYLPGSNWVEFYERVRNLVSAFVLLTEGRNADISRVFQTSDGFVLSKPVDEAEFDRLLSTIEATAEKPLNR